MVFLIKKKRSFFDRFGDFGDRFDRYLTYRYYKESNRDQVMATRYPLSALAFPCVTMLWLSSQMSVPLTTAAGSKHMAILSNVNCTLSSSCMKDKDKFYRLVVIAETIMEVTRPNTSNKLRNSSNPRNRNVLYPETPVNTTNSSIMLFRMDEQGFTGEKVTSAVLKIYIKTKGKRRRRRIILHVSENTEDGKLAEFATIKLRVKRKGWQKINLPVYLLKKLQHQPIKLHVGCEKCNKKVRVVLPLKKSKKSQEFRDLGSRKRRSPIIVLNTKPNPAAAAAAAAAVAAAVTTRRLRRPRRDIFRFGPRTTVPESSDLTVGQPVVKINTDSDSAKGLLPRLMNIGGFDKSETIAQRKNRGVQDVDDGARNVPKRRKTTRSTCADGRDTQVNNNLEEKSTAGNNYDYSIDEYDDDVDDDDDSSPFASDDDDDNDDGDNDDDNDDEEAEEKEEDGEHISREEDENGGLNRGCCMRSRFVSFRSIGLSGLVVRPRLGFVSNQCSDLCPADHLQVTPPAKADFGNSGGVVVATQGKKRPGRPYWNTPQEVADLGRSEYTDQPKILEENSRKSLLDKLTNSPTPRFISERPRVRPPFPLPPFNLRQNKRQHPFRDRKNRVYYVHHNSPHEGQHDYYKRRAIRNDNGVNTKNGNNSKKRAKEKDSHKTNYKKLPRRRSCGPVEYKNLKLSFITADMKVEKMTLPDAIVSKCGYV